MRIAIAGTGRLGTSLLNPLLDSTHEVVAVILNGRATKGHRRWLDPFLGRFTGENLSVAGVAARYGVPRVFIDRMTDDELAPLRDLEPDLILVGGFAIILKQPILHLPEYGCINCHSSLLPYHRGPNPFTAAILAGDDLTGVTFHQMDEGIDTGPIVKQYEVTIRPDETAGSLYERCCEIARAKVCDVVDAIENAGGITGAAQNPDAGSYKKKLEGDDLFLDWTDPAEYLERKIRACNPFTLARFRCRGHVVYVTRAACDTDPVDAPPGTVLESRRQVRVATAQGSLTVQVAMTRTPVPWVWPSPLNHPKAGETLQ